MIIIVEQHICHVYIFILHLSHSVLFSTMFGTVLICGVVVSQSEEEPERSFGCPAEGCGAHLLHQLPGSGGRQAAENYTGMMQNVFCVLCNAFNFLCSIKAIFFFKST